LDEVLADEQLAQAGSMDEATKETEGVLMG
jgi:hypothetical protein